MLLPRERVHRTIARAAAFPIVVFSAPTGYGKSVAARHYFETTNHPHAFCQVRDASLQTFMRGLTRALHVILPTHGEERPPLLRSFAAEDVSHWLQTRCESFPHTIVIDDLHRATDPLVVPFLRQIIEDSVPNTRWFVTTRSEDDLPIGAWTSRGLLGSVINETDLTLTIPEAHAIIAQSGLDLSEEDVQRILEITQGWPAALSIALQTWSGASNLDQASNKTRELLFNYFADQVFSALEPPDREFLLSTCVYPIVYAGKLWNIGIDFIQTLDRLERRMSFVHGDGQGSYQYHDLFRAFLLRELRNKGRKYFVRTVQAQAEIYERAGIDGDALRLYVEILDHGNIHRVLRNRGFATIGRGFYHVVRSALDALDKSYKDDPIIRGLEAAMEANYGSFEIARNKYEHAISRAANRNDRAQLVVRYARELALRFDAEAIPLLEGVLNSDALGRSGRIRALAHLGYIQAVDQQLPAAFSTMRKTFALLGESSSERDKAWGYLMAGAVHFYGGDYDKAREYAVQARNLGVAIRHPGLTASAERVLFDLAYECDEVAEQRRAAEDMLRHALAAGETEWEYIALLQLYSVASLRGDDEEMKRLDHLFDAMKTTSHIRALMRVRPIAKASNAARSGNFKEAFEIIRGTHDKLEGFGDVLASRLAAIAMMAAGAGEHDAADQYVRLCLDEVGRPSNRRQARAILSCVVALSVVGKFGQANHLLSSVEKQSRRYSVRFNALLKAVQMFSQYCREPGTERDAELEAALVRLRDQQYDGLARELRALKHARQKGESRFVSLTRGEREILVSIVAGLTSKQIAERTNRSPKTVDGYAQSICKKIGVRRRAEAVSLALEHSFISAEEARARANVS